MIAVKLIEAINEETIVDLFDSGDDLIKKAHKFRQWPLIPRLRKKMNRGIVVH